MKEKLTFPTEQLVNGELISPPQEICLVCAERVFKERRENGDTNPQIVQMVSGGVPIPHWYYRSDQWIEQPYFKPSEFIQPHVGPADQAMPFRYGEEDFIVDEEMTDLFKNKYM